MEGETPGDRVEILRRKIASLRPNLLSRIGQSDVGDLQPVSVPLTGQNLRIVSAAGDKVDQPREVVATERSDPSFAGPRAPGPLMSIISTLLQPPQPSQAELEAVRLAERQRARAELARAEQLRREREAAADKARAEKPAVL